MVEIEGSQPLRAARAVFGPDRTARPVGTDRAV